MKVLVACEFSGRVRDAFIAEGHQALSCDFEETEAEGPHYRGNVLDIIEDTACDFDLMISHPSCNNLAVSGAWVFHRKRAKQAEDLLFVRKLLLAKIPRICLENPISIISTEIRKPDQIIQPWQFGHGEVKTTCLWLKNLPPLRPTNIVPGRAENILNMGGAKKDRPKNRSRTYPGIAQAMAMQWGSLQGNIQLQLWQ